MALFLAHRTFHARAIGVIPSTSYWRSPGSPRRVRWVRCGTDAAAARCRHAAAAPRRLLPVVVRGEKQRVIQCRDFPC
jgi:hypothetical protein